MNDDEKIELLKNDLLELGLHLGGRTLWDDVNNLIMTGHLVGIILSEIYGISSNIPDTALEIAKEFQDDLANEFFTKYRVLNSSMVSEFKE